MGDRVSEGKAVLSVGNGVFYNPKMKELRDISIMFLRSMDIDKGAELLDSTSASGARGIRYVLEAGIGNATFLDMNRSAYLCTKRNLLGNSIRAAAYGKSIQEFCNTTKKKFDVIDLDPFGSPAPDLYDIMKVVKDGSVIMVTATDTAVLCGAQTNACIKIYGSRPLHNALCREAGMRILIGFIARTAAQFNFGIDVKLSVSNMHYMRVFAVLRHGAAHASDSVKQTGFGSCCNRCYNFSYEKGITPKHRTKCENCGSSGNALEYFGPLWLGNMYDKNVVGKMIRMGGKTGKHLDPKSIDFVRRIHEELDVPFFYPVPKITRYLKIGSVSPEKVMKKLGRKYLVSKTQFGRDCIKTDAGIADVTKVVKTL